MNNANLNSNSYNYNGDVSFGPHHRSGEYAGPNTVGDWSQHHAHAGHWLGTGLVGRGHLGHHSAFIGDASHGQAYYTLPVGAGLRAAAPAYGQYFGADYGVRGEGHYLPWGAEGVRHVDGRWDGQWDGRWNARDHHSDYRALGVWGRNYGLPSYNSVAVSETPEELTVTCEIPGVEEKDCEVCFQNGYLTIRGEKKPTEDERKASYQFNERRFGRFNRCIALTDIAGMIDESKISAKYNTKGILSVTLPKKKQNAANFVRVTPSK